MKPKPNTHVLSDYKQVRALADPLRMRLLEAFSTKPQTTKQVALLLGEKPTRLYHHVELLERVGLVRLVSTRRNRGTVEKYYEAVAREFTVDRKLLEVNKPGAGAARGYESLFLSALEATVEEARQSVKTGLILPVQKSRNALILREQVTSDTSGLPGLLKRFSSHVKQCVKQTGNQKSAEFRVALVLYPVKAKRKRS